MKGGRGHTGLCDNNPTQAALQEVLMRLGLPFMTDVDGVRRKIASV